MPGLQEFVAAAGQLSATEDPAKLKAAADALAAMLPLTDRIAALVDLRAALTVLQAVGTTDAFVASALEDLEAVQGVADAVAAIAGTLHMLQVRRQLGTLCFWRRCDTTQGSMSVPTWQVCKCRFGTHTGPSACTCRTTTPLPSPASRRCWTGQPTSMPQCCCCPTVWRARLPCCRRLRWERVVG